MVIVLIDASEPLTEQDQRVITMVIEAGAALVIAMNKGDLVDEDRRYLLDREIDLDLAQVQWAQRVNISAKTGRAVQKLVPALEKRTRIVGRPHSDGRPDTFFTRTWLLPRRRRCVAANSPRSCSPRRRRRARRPSCCSPRASSRPGIAGSSSASYARRSVSTAARSASMCACGRSAEWSAGDVLNARRCSAAHYPKNRESDTNLVATSTHGERSHSLTNQTVRLGSVIGCPSPT